MSSRSVSSTGFGVLLRLRSLPVFVRREGSGFSPRPQCQSHHQSLPILAGMKPASLLTTVVRAVSRRLALVRNRRTTFRHDLSICAIFKNEAHCLDEWLTFHEGVGVEHFYLYDDASHDGFRAVLHPWMQRGLVTLRDWADRDQMSAYNHCLRRCRMQTRWLAFIDLDEFLFSPRHFDLRTALQQYPDVPALFVYWVLFGSAGHQARPAGPVLESFTRCLPPGAAVRDAFDHRSEPGKAEYVTGWARDGKSIVNPRLVKKYAVHKPQMLWSGQTLDENRCLPRQRVDDCALSFETFRINHYWSKSIQDLREKVARGSVCDKRRPPRDLERWLQREAMLNEAEDLTILEHWNRIRRPTAARPAAA